MEILGWIIIGVFAAAYVFGMPYLISGGYDYFGTLIWWMGFLAVATIVLFILLFAVSAVSGG